MTFKERIIFLGKLKEERDLIEQKLRQGVKERWTGNTGYFLFKDLRKSLTTSNKNRIEDLKRSVII